LFIPVVLVLALVVIGGVSGAMFLSGVFEPLASSPESEYTEPNTNPHYAYDISTHAGGEEPVLDVDFESGFKIASLNATVSMPNRTVTRSPAISVRDGEKYLFSLPGNQSELDETRLRIAATPRTQSDPYVIEYNVSAFEWNQEYTYETYPSRIVCSMHTTECVRPEFQQALNGTQTGVDEDSSYRTTAS
jgi:hypothetical protein